MKNIFNFVLIFSILLIAESCEKDLPITSKPIDHSKDFLNETRFDRSNGSSEYFIRGEFDGKLIYFTSYPNLYSGYETSWNTQFVDNSGLDQINLIRQDKTNSVQIAIFFQQSNIFNRQMPYFVPGANGEFAELQLINLKRLGSAIQGSTEDNFTFWECTARAIQIKVSSVADSTLIGTFEGYITSNTGSTILIKNGLFRIKVKEYKFLK